MRKEILRDWKIIITTWIFRIVVIIGLYIAYTKIDNDVPGLVFIIVFGLALLVITARHIELSYNLTGILYRKKYLGLFNVDKTINYPDICKVESQIGLKSNWDLLLLLISFTGPMVHPNRIIIEMKNGEKYKFRFAIPELRIKDFVEQIRSRV
jgi:hypothetical protein